jgi:hypothetical protein
MCDATASASGQFGRSGSAFSFLRRCGPQAKPARTQTACSFRLLCALLHGFSARLILVLLLQCAAQFCTPGLPGQPSRCPRLYERHRTVASQFVYHVRQAASARAGSVSATFRHVHVHINIPLRSYQWT